MSTNRYHSLGDVNSGSYNWNVKVRIIRSWRGVSFSGEEFKGLNILLLDDQVCVISRILKIFYLYNTLSDLCIIYYSLITISYPE